MVHPMKRIRRFLALSFAFGACGAVPAGGGFALPAADGQVAGIPAAVRHSVTTSMRVMGSYANVIVVTADSAKSAPAVRAAQSVFLRVDSLMSNWTTTSEIARLNRVAGTKRTRVEPEVAGVIAEAMQVWRQSGGAFDITVEPLIRAWGFLGGPKRVPSEREAAAAFRLVGGRHIAFDPVSRMIRFRRPGVRIDLGGIAQGYAADVAAETLRTRGVTDALIDVSGDMVALGTPEGATAWRIGIRDPRDRMPYFGRLHVTGEAVTTSGKYEQFVAADGKTYGHILDPRTGRPAEGLISVTVVSRTAIVADGWDTGLFAMGPVDARRVAHERDDIDVVLVEPGAGDVDTVWVEEALRDRFSLEPAAARSFRVEYF